MKKTIFATILVMSLILSLPLLISASQLSTSTDSTVDAHGNTIYYYDDGSYTIVSPVLEVATQTTRAAVNSKTESVNATNYASNGDVNWVYTLYGYFTYEEGVSCTCTNATYTTSISGSGWSFSNGSSSWSNNVAYGSGVFKHKVLFITNNTVNVNLQIHCDSYENLS